MLLVPEAYVALFKLNAEGYAKPRPLVFPKITGGEEKALLAPTLGAVFLFRYYLKVMAPPPALLMLPYFLVVFTRRVR